MVQIGSKWSSVFPGRTTKREQLDVTQNSRKLDGSFRGSETSLNSESRSETDKERNETFSEDRCISTPESGCCAKMKMIDATEKSSDDSEIFAQNKIGLNTEMDYAGLTDVFLEKKTKLGAVKNDRTLFKPHTVPSEDVDLYFKAMLCVKKKSFEELLELITKHPSIILYDYNVQESNAQSPCAHGGTLLHVLVSQRPRLVKKKSRLCRKTFEKNRQDSSDDYEVHVVPLVTERAVLHVIDLMPQALYYVDGNGRLPLHCAVITVRNHLQEIHHLFGGNKIKSNVQIRYVQRGVNYIHHLIRSSQNAASICDYKGNLALHYAASFAPEVNVSSCDKLTQMNPSTEAILRLLLDAFPRGIIFKNEMGYTPIQLLCTRGPNINLSCLRTMLSFHCLQRDSSSEIIEISDPDPPLHIALRSGATIDAIRVFSSAVPPSTAIDFFIETDKYSNMPLHVALTCSNVVSVDIISSIISMAPCISHCVDNEGIMPIVRATSQKMPGSIIYQMLEHDMPIELDACRTRIVRKAHRHSWWHVAVECNDFYLDTLRDFLSERASPAQIITLARQTGPDGHSLVMNNVSTTFIKMLLTLLMLYNRYELQIISDVVACPDDPNVTVFDALDHGPSARNASDFSVQTKKEIVLMRCYRFEEPYRAEKNVRDRFQLSSEYIEEVISYHCGEQNPNLRSTLHEQTYSIVFKRPLHTLEDIFARTTNEDRCNTWIRKSQVVLEQILEALKHLHDYGLVHGYISPTSVAKFGNRWKLTNVGLVTSVGCAMRGRIRCCVPPESVIEAFRSPTVPPSYPRVRFNDKSSSPRGNRQGEKHRSLVVGVTRSDSCFVFAPESIRASPAFDLWGVGIIMVQLFLGRCPFLPNFERADDALLRNLYNYDMTNLTRICELVNSVNNEAADLVFRLLHPDPDQRPTSVGTVLKHPYFRKS